MLLRTTALVAAFFPLGGVAAFADTDPLHRLYQVEANQLGVVEYCLSRGWVDGAAIDAQRRIAAILPASSDSSGLSDAEDDGRRGTLVINGNKVALTDAASDIGTTAQVICTQMGDTVKAVAASLHNITLSQATPLLPQ